MMKKYLIIAVAAVATMAACSKVETVDNAPDSPIRFSVVNHMQRTKAATQGLTYPTSVPFGANAWWTQETWDNTAASSKQTYVFMVNQEVAYDATNAEWAPTVPFYWTKTGYITFASYSPYVDDSTKASKGFSAIPEYNVNNGYIFTDYTIVDGTNVDLMYSDLAADCTKNTNKNGADVTDDLSGSADSRFVGVPTIFNHALCQIGFEFRAIGRMNPNVDRIVVELEDVDIVNIDKKGTFTQIPSSGTVKWASDHTAAANLANYDYQPASTITLNLIESTSANLAATNNYTALDVTRILLPQNLEDDDDPTDSTVDPIETTTDQKLVVTYTIKMHYVSAPSDESDPAYWATEQVVSSVRLNNGNITAWRDNQNITYRISINPYNIVPVTFDPAVVDWTDVYSSDITITHENS